MHVFSVFCSPPPLSHFGPSLVPLLQLVMVWLAGVRDVVSEGPV